MTSQDLAETENAGTRSEDGTAAEMMIEEVETDSAGTETEIGTGIGRKVEIVEVDLEIKKTVIEKASMETEAIPLRVIFKCFLQMIPLFRCLHNTGSEV